MERTDALLVSINDRLGILTEGRGGADILPLGLAYLDDLMGHSEREADAVDELLEEAKRAHSN